MAFNGYGDEGAYEAGIRRRIAQNIAKKRPERLAAWNAVSGNPELIEWLFAIKADGYSYVQRGEFMDSMRRNFDQYGSLTDKMRAALINSKEKADARKAEFVARDASSVHVGTVGERVTWTLTLQFTTSFAVQFGTVYIYNFKDSAGNVVVYKGSTYLGIEKGDSITLKGTIKEHTVYNGVRQTVLARVKKQ